tara:strand:+ start:145 stop:270 length:126 start_codon:yes stop_codon:yes gene_type:complete
MSDFLAATNECILFIKVNIGVWIQFQIYIDMAKIMMIEMYS